MDAEKIIQITNDVKNKSNKDLFLALGELETEFDNTKKIIIDLTHHLDGIEAAHIKISKELQNRVKK